MRGAEERGVEMDTAQDFEAVTGEGVKGIIDGSSVALGNARLVDDLGLDTGDAAATANGRQDTPKIMTTDMERTSVCGSLSVQAITASEFSLCRIVKSGEEGQWQWQWQWGIMTTNLRRN